MMLEYLNEFKILNDFKETPITIIILILNSIVWLYQFTNQVDISIISFNYKDINQNKQHWRIISSTFSHINLIHLLFNSISIWNLKEIEIIKGSFYYFKSIIILIFLTNLLLFLEIKISKKLKLESYLDFNYIGYSCVCFGQMVIYISIITNSIINYYPFLSLLYSSFFIQNASMISHLNGILIGILINLKLFDSRFYNNYIPTISNNTFYVITIISLIYFLVNYYNHHPKQHNTMLFESQPFSILNNITYKFKQYFLKRNNNNNNRDIINTINNNNNNNNNNYVYIKNYP